MSYVWFAVTSPVVFVGPISSTSHGPVSYFLSSVGGKNDGLEPSPEIVSQFCTHSIKLAYPPELPLSSIQRPLTHVNVVNGFCSVVFHMYWFDVSSDLAKHPLNNRCPSFSLSEIQLYVFNSTSCTFWLTTVVTSLSDFLEMSEIITARWGSSPTNIVDPLFVVQEQMV